MGTGNANGWRPLKYCFSRRRLAPECSCPGTACPVQAMTAIQVATFAPNRQSLTYNGGDKTFIQTSG